MRVCACRITGPRIVCRGMSAGQVIDVIKGFTHADGVARLEMDEFVALVRFLRELESDGVRLEVVELLETAQGLGATHASAAEMAPAWAPTWAPTWAPMGEAVLREQAHAGESPKPHVPRRRQSVHSGSKLKQEGTHGEQRRRASVHASAKLNALSTPQAKPKPPTTTTSAPPPPTALPKVITPGPVNDEAGTAPGVPRRRPPRQRQLSISLHHDAVAAASSLSTANLGDVQPRRGSFRVEVPGCPGLYEVFGGIAGGPVPVAVPTESSANGQSSALSSGALLQKPASAVWIEPEPSKIRRLSEYLQSGRTGFTPRGDDAAARDGAGASCSGAAPSATGAAGALSAPSSAEEPPRRRRSSATLEMIDYIKGLGDASATNAGVVPVPLAGSGARSVTTLEA